MPHFLLSKGEVGIKATSRLRRYGLQALPMKFQDHDEFSKFDHRAAPSRHQEKHR